jgi:Zn-dependent peptidase ImmA (M78 family)
MKEIESIAKKEASEFRQKHGLTSDEPIRLESLLLKENVLTIFAPLSENFSGMAIKYENDKFMLINCNQTIGRQNFSIAHELYHLFVQKDFVPKLSRAGNFDKKDKVEYQADNFAVYLLMPENGIYSLIPDDELRSKELGIRTLLKISSYYQVSWEFTLNRLVNLNIILKPYRESLQQFKELHGIKKLALMYGGDESLYKAGNNNLVIGEYASIAKSLFDYEKISEINYLNMMFEIGLEPSDLNETTTY